MILEKIDQKGIVVIDSDGAKVTIELPEENAIKLLNVPHVRWRKAVDKNDLPQASRGLAGKRQGAESPVIVVPDDKSESE